MSAMTPRERLVAALDRRTPDRLPVTTHHVMPFFLNKYMDGISVEGFFDTFGFDPIVWTLPMLPNAAAGEYIDNDSPGAIGAISSDTWRVTSEPVTGLEFPTTRYTIHTPGGNLTTTLQFNEHTMWVTEHIIKEKTDIDLIERYMTTPVSDVAAVNRLSAEVGQSRLVRGHIPGFDIFGQPGTWQDAACLVGIERLIMETYTDPEWVHTLLRSLQRRKRVFIDSLAGAEYDVLELGGGDASCTVISPTLFDEYVAPYDAPLIEAAHAAGQRIVYHTCGGMMSILENLAAMKPDACETFTPVGMGGDTRLAEAKRRIGDKVCMVGGFDQFHHFLGCSEAETRAAVRRCFEEAGAGGGFILSPSDHFFDADLPLLAAFADEARKMVYD